VKRLSVLLLAVLTVVVAGALTACGPSPKARTDEFVKYLPAAAGDWEQDDKKTVKLLSSTVTSKGHVTLFYNGPDDAVAYIVIEAHPSTDAAEVALSDRMRDLIMRGLVFENQRDPKPKREPAQVAQDGRTRYALFQAEEVVVEIDVLSADEEHLVSDESFDQLLTLVRNAYAKINEDK
jgi:hypothetical protein